MVPLQSLQRCAPKPQEFQQVRLRTAKAKVLGRAAAAKMDAWFKKGTGNALIFVYAIGWNSEKNGKYIFLYTMRYAVPGLVRVFWDQILSALQLPSNLRGLPTLWSMSAATNRSHVFTTMGYVSSLGGYPSSSCQTRVCRSLGYWRLFDVQVYPEN